MMTNKKPMDFSRVPKDELSFLEQSNYIEREYGHTALEDSVVAWEYLKKQEINLRTVCTAHLLLMRRLNKPIAGKIRDCDVYIGGEKKTFISQTLIEEDLNELFEVLRWNIDYYKNIPVGTPFSVVDTINYHVDFEDIHPFEDGNGRIGRMIYNIHRLELSLGIHIIHEGEEQMEYYKWFEKGKNND